MGGRAYAVSQCADGGDAEHGGARPRVRWAHGTSRHVSKWSSSSPSRRALSPRAPARRRSLKVPSAGPCIETALPSHPPLLFLLLLSLLPWSCAVASSSTLKPSWRANGSMLPRNDEPPSTDERPDDDAPGLQAANPATERGVSKLDLRLFHPLSSAKMPTNPPLSSKDERGVDAWCLCCVDVCQPKQMLFTRLWRVH